MKTHKIIVLTIGMLFASVSQIATAQSVCEGLSHVIKAGMTDWPVFSSLSLYSFPGASCETNIRPRKKNNRSSARFECVWPAERQDLGEREQDERAKKFADTIDKCHTSGALPIPAYARHRRSKTLPKWKVSDGEYEMRTISWSDQNFRYSTDIEVEFSHMGMLKKLRPDHDDALYMQIYFSKKRRK